MKSTFDNRNIMRKSGMTAAALIQFYPQLLNYSGEHVSAHITQKYFIKNGIFLNRLT
jgi:hypothetical protein